MTLDSPRGSGASGRFTAPTAPYAHGSVVRAGDDPLRIAREVEPARDVLVPREASDGVALSQVEEQTGPRGVDARERAAVGRELGVRRALGVPAQHESLGAALDAPNARRAVDPRGRRDFLSVGTERALEQVTRMPLQHVQGLAAARVPQARGGVDRRGHHGLPVRAPGGTHDALVMSSELRLEVRAFEPAHEGGRAGGGAHEQRAAIGTKARQDAELHLPDGGNDLAVVGTPYACFGLLVRGS